MRSFSYAHAKAAPASPSAACLAWRGLACLLLAILAGGCFGTPIVPMPARQMSGRPRVACIGDSITAGAGLPNPAASAYPAVLGEILGPAYEVRNFGVSGATMLQDGDHPYAATPEFTAAREYLPQVVVIALGTNDSKPPNWRYRNTFERDVYRMVRSFLTLPSQPVVYLCTPPPVFQDHWGITSNVVAREITPTLRRLSTREGWPLIDLQIALRTGASHFPDGVHPDAVGAASIASTVEGALRGR
jgi:lysophospholipase L1-like esterase